MNDLPMSTVSDRLARSIRYRAGRVLARSEQLFGPTRLAGAVDYFLDLVPRDRWGGAMNGQDRRLELVSEILDAIAFEIVVETGTYRGSTAAWLAGRTQSMVYTVDSNPRFYEYARRRLAGHRNLRAFLGDSREFLARLAAEPAAEPAFFYLDAHWNSDLPLASEIALILENWEQSVVLVDDFRVPDDPGYGWDSYSGIGEISLDLLEDIVPGGLVHYFFPSAPSNEETGARRGSAVITASSRLYDTLAGLRGLREVVPESHFPVD